MKSMKVKNKIYLLAGFSLLAGCGHKTFAFLPQTLRLF